MPTIIREGVQLHYSDSGEHGPALLFHTGTGGDGTMWELAGYTDFLTGWRHLLVDHRGHGRSGRPAGLQAHRMEEYVADALAVLDACGVRRAAMLGYSDGARLLYALAARHPERVAAVVGIGGVPHPNGPDAPRAEWAAEVRRVGVRAWIERTAAEESEPPPPWLVDNLVATPTEMFALELEGWSTAPSECEEFPLIQAPTLIVCGELENADGAAEAAVAALPDGSAVVLPGFGHLQAFWHAEVTGPVIRDFLDTQDVLAPERSI